MGEAGIAPQDSDFGHMEDGCNSDEVVERIPNDGISAPATDSGRSATDSGKKEKRRRK